MPGGRLWSVAAALVIAVLAASLISIAGANAARFEASTLDLYVDARGTFNLAVPGEAEGLFRDDPGPGIEPGEAGLAVYVDVLGAAVGLAQGTQFESVSPPAVISNTSEGRLVQTAFSASDGSTPLFDVTQTIFQSKVTRTAAVTYSITNTYDDNLPIRPFLIGNLRLDSANSAFSTYAPPPVPILRAASTTTPRLMTIYPNGNQPVNSAQVESWEVISQIHPNGNIPFGPFIPTEFTDPAVGFEWSHWSETSLPFDGSSAVISAVYSFSTGEPQRGVTAVAEPVRGTVLVKAPGGTFQELDAGADIPIGSIVDTRAGTVRLTSSGAGGEDQTADFRYGLFRVDQRRSSALTTLKMVGPLSGCRGRRAVEEGRVATRSSFRKGRALWGRGKGKFKVSGKRGSGSVRGTTWQVTDRCDGATVIRSIRGVVEARDFGKGRKFQRVLRSGQRYVARPRR